MKLLLAAPASAAAAPTAAPAPGCAPACAARRHLAPLWLVAASLAPLGYSYCINGRRGVVLGVAGSGRPALAAKCAAGQHWRRRAGAARRQSGGLTLASRSCCRRRCGYYCWALVALPPSPDRRRGGSGRAFAEAGARRGRGACPAVLSGVEVVSRWLWWGDVGGQGLGRPPMNAATSCVLPAAAPMIAVCAAASRT